MSDCLQMPWEIKDTISHLECIRDSLIRRLRKINFEGKAEQDVTELNYDFNRAIKALQENQQYHQIGTPGECSGAMEALKWLHKYGIDDWETLVEEMEHFERLKKHEVQCLDKMGDPLEPLKISSALDSEIRKFEYRKEHDLKSISILDYTIMAALVEALEKRTGEDG